MDVEQRIGRIHRYGQQHTAQVYNLVLSDTIEGRIFLLLDTKLREIGKALGKMDEQGNVAEDLRSQILGQLSERLSYERLYQEALSDPELRRTNLEVDAALANASEARKVVFDLFQDLEGFSLEDYRPFADVARGMARLVKFLGDACSDDGLRMTAAGPAPQSDRFDVTTREGAVVHQFTTDRDTAAERDDLDLLGLDHPVVQQALERWRSVPPETIGVAVRAQDCPPGVLTWWQVETRTPGGQTAVRIQPVGVGLDGSRLPPLERLGDALFRFAPAGPTLTAETRGSLLREHVEPTLQRDLHHRGAVPEGGSYSAQLIGWVEVAPPQPTGRGVDSCTQMPRS